jgi:hypothetical protein
MNPPAILPLTRYRITAVMHDELRLPDYAGSLLRGVFGAALRKAACMTGMPACPACPLWRTCPYPALFETPPQATQLRQQFSQVPNPYVIEPPPLGTRSIGAGEALVFHMVLIGAQAQRQLPLVQYAWQRALKQGLGKERIPGELIAMEATEPFTSVENVDDVDEVDQPKQLTLQIHTPLRLQHNGHALGTDELSPRVLLSQLLRRTSLMMELHMGIHPAPFDAPALLGPSATRNDLGRRARRLDLARPASAVPAMVASGPVAALGQERHDGHGRVSPHAGLTRLSSPHFTFFNPPSGCET